MKHGVRLAVAFMFSAMVAVASAATPPPRYHLTVLGTFGNDWSAATGISESGVVVGNTYRLVDVPGTGQFLVGYVPFMFDHGAATLLPVPNGRDGASANAVNSAGVVAGAAFNIADIGFGPLPDATSYRAISTQGGVLTELGGIRSTANSINSSGVLAGRSRFGNSNRAALFVGGQVVDLGAAPGNTSSSASAINDAGDAVGNSFGSSGLMVATRFSQGQAMALDIGGRSSTARGMNNLGQIVGSVEAADGSRTTAFLYSNGQVTDLGTLGGLEYAQAYDINNAGWIVGMAIYPDRIENIPFLRIDGDLIDLNTLVTSESLGDWLVSDVYAINDNGQMAGAVVRDGVKIAALLTPVPDQPIYSLLLLGLVVLAARRSRQQR